MLPRSSKGLPAIRARIPTRALPHVHSSYKALPIAIGLAVVYAGADQGRSSGKTGDGGESEDVPHIGPHQKQTSWIGRNLTSGAPAPAPLYRAGRSTFHRAGPDPFMEAGRER